MGLIKQDWKKGVLWLAITVAVAVLVIIPHQCSGKNVSSMYREEVLMRLKERYPGNISWNLEHVIKPVLTKEELAALQDLRLEYPLIGGEGDPFTYFAKIEENRRRIVIPIFSVKFLDDMATAVAWLRHNDFTTETLPKYISMLKYRGVDEFKVGRYPTPLEALHIPDRPPDDESPDDESKVDELAQDLLKSTVVYLLSREVGFLYFSRPYSSTKKFQGEQRPQQMQMPDRGWGARSEQKELMLKSDAFALEIMKRIGILPHKLSFYLSAQTYWTRNRIDFSNEEDYLRYWYRPPEYAMFSERLRHIADLMVWGKEDYVRQQDDETASAVQIEEIAREIFSLSYILERESMQWEIKQRALKQTLDDLVHIR